MYHQKKNLRVEFRNKSTLYHFKKVTTGISKRSQLSLENGKTESTISPDNSAYTEDTVTF